jgi:dolichol-phosphate mannosyltransferase
MTAVWTVIPTYREAENIEPLVTAVRDALARVRPAVDWTVLVVDDDSPDGTGLIADDLARRHPDVRVLHRAGKGGLASAYAEGFDLAMEAGADHVVEMDADFSHDPADLGRLLAAAAAGFDVVLGSRYVDGGATPGWDRRRRWLSAGGGAYARAVLGLPQRDLTGGYKCLSAAAVRAIDPGSLTAKGYAFQVEATYRAVRAGCSVAEVPIVFHDRRHGTSKMSAGIAAEALWRLPLIRLQAAAGSLVTVPAAGRRPIGSRTAG